MVETRSVATQTNLSYAHTKKHKKAKYYAVRRGRRPGIYRTYAECYEQVFRFSNPKYKSFELERDARVFMQLN